MTTEQTPCRLCADRLELPLVQQAGEQGGQVVEPVLPDIQPCGSKPATWWAKSAGTRS